jgi:hypothetical protein
VSQGKEASPENLSEKTQEICPRAHAPEVKRYFPSSFRLDCSGSSLSA